MLGQSEVRGGNSKRCLKTVVCCRPVLFVFRVHNIVGTITYINSTTKMCRFDGPTVKASRQGYIPDVLE